MNVHAAQARSVEQRPRENKAVGHHDQDIRAPALKLIKRRTVLRRRRLRHRQACRKRGLLHDTCAQALAAAPRPIGPREDTHEAVSRMEHSLQCSARELGRSCKRNSQRGHGRNRCKA